MRDLGYTASIVRADRGRLQRSEKEVEIQGCLSGERRPVIQSLCTEV